MIHTAPESAFWILRMELELERELKLSRVDDLRGQQLREGGCFVVYLSCWSLVFFSCTKPALVWVSPGQSRRWKGMAHSLSSLSLGWWSFGGVLNTLLVVAHNLLGGFDLTPVIMDPKTRDGEYRWEKTDHLRSFQRRRFGFFLLLLMAVVLLVIPLMLYLLLDGFSR